MSIRLTYEEFKSAALYNEKPSMPMEVRFNGSTISVRANTATVGHAYESVLQICGSRMHLRPEIRLTCDDHKVIMQFIEPTKGGGEITSEYLAERLEELKNQKEVDAKRQEMKAKVKEMKDYDETYTLVIGDNFAEQWKYEHLVGKHAKHLYDIKEMRCAVVQVVDDPREYLIRHADCIIRTEGRTSVDWNYEHDYSYDRH